MLIFTTTFLPMNFCTRTLFIPWLLLPIYYLLLLLYRSSHHCCQYHSFLFTMLWLITTLTSSTKGFAIKVFDVPTTTIILSKTGVNLLQIGGQTTSNRPGKTLVLGIGLDSSMYAANCAPVSATQLPSVPSFATALNDHMLILLLPMNLLWLGFPTPAPINT